LETESRWTAMAGVVVRVEAAFDIFLNFSR